MFKEVVIGFLILIGVTVLALVLDQTTLLQTHIECINELHIDQNIATNMIQLDSTLPEDSPELTKLAECEIDKMHLLHKNGTIAAQKFKKLFYTLLDYDPTNPYSNRTTQLIEKGYKHCGVQREILFNGEIAIKLYNCLINYIMKKGKTNIKPNIKDEPMELSLENDV